MLPIGQDDATGYLIGLTQGLTSLDDYTHHFNDFLRRTTTDG
jgi:hypothetical protein